MSLDYRAPSWFEREVALSWIYCNAFEDWTNSLYPHIKRISWEEATHTLSTWSRAGNKKVTNHISMHTRALLSLSLCVRPRKRCRFVKREVILSFQWENSMHYMYSTTYSATVTVHSITPAFSYRKLNMSIYHLHYSLTEFSLWHIKKVSRPCCFSGVRYCSFLHWKITWNIIANKHLMGTYVCFGWIWMWCQASGQTLRVGIKITPQPQ